MTASEYKESNLRELKEERFVRKKIETGDRVVWRDKSDGTWHYGKVIRLMSGMVRNWVRVEGLDGLVTELELE